MLLIVLFGLIGFALFKLAADNGNPFVVIGFITLCFIGFLIQGSQDAPIISATVQTDR